MRTVALAGLLALTALLGGAVAVPGSAMAQPASGGRPVRAVGAVSAVSAVTTRDALATVPAGPRRADFAIVNEGGGPAISCVLATDCLAVAGMSGRNGELGSALPARVARWNGRSWKRIGLTLPTGAKLVDLDAVSCRGATFCLAVGDYYKSGVGSARSYPLALVYNGTSLRPAPPLPLPKAPQNAALVGVSCTTSRSCVAVGLAGGTPGVLGAGVDGNSFIETWNGVRWTLHAAASPAKTKVELSGVSCAAPAFCVMTGETAPANSVTANGQLYLGSWNGGKLTAMRPAEAGNAGNELVPTGVSCATRSHCAVTGADFGAAAVRAFTQVWNGRGWQVAKTTWPKGIAGSLLWGLSCYGAQSCEAVGFDGAHQDGTAPVDAAAVSYRGTIGTVQATPKPPRGRSNGLGVVSCLPWGTCVALGEIFPPTTTTPAFFTGVWNGRNWKVGPGF